MKWHTILILCLSICFLAGTGAYAYGISKTGQEWMAIHKAIKDCNGSWSIYASKMKEQITWGKFKCEAK